MLSEDDLMSRVAESIAMVVPSEWYENASISVHQSFSAGTPVIASDIGGLPEQVVQNETGWLIRPGHSGDLIEAMNQAKSNQTNTRAMGAECHSRANGVYSPEAHLASTVNVYTQVLQGENQR